MQRAHRLRTIRRQRKARGVRARVQGTAERPRLSVHRSAKQIYAQAIDDRRGVTLASSSSLDKGLRSGLSGPKTDAARAVGESIARRLLDQGVQAVVFDRGWYRYHGRVKALAEAAREAGLKF